MVAPYDTSIIAKRRYVKRPDEVITYGMDFAHAGSSLLESGETISSITSVVATRVDDNGDEISGGEVTLTIGTPAQSGSNAGIVQVEISAGTSGHNYRLDWTVETSIGNTRIAASILMIRG